MTATKRIEDIARRCAASFSIEYRQYSCYYETLKQAVENRTLEIDEEDFLSPEDKARCLETDCYWVIHFYPTSPVGFYNMIGSDLDMLLNWAEERMKEYGR